MTPREKAEELVDRFTKHAKGDQGVGEWDFGINIENAKQCAVIACDEIVRVLKEDVSFSMDAPSIGSGYWQEVKRIIKEEL